MEVVEYRQAEIGCISDNRWYSEARGIQVASRTLLAEQVLLSSLNYQMYPSKSWIDHYCMMVSASCYSSETGALGEISWTPTETRGMLTICALRTRLQVTPYE